MHNIHSLKFDSSLISGWQKLDDTDRGHGWIDKLGDEASKTFTVDFFPEKSPVDSRILLSNLDLIIQQRVEFANQTGLCLILQDIVESPSGLIFLRTFEKRPQDPSGMAYTGSLTLLDQAFFRITLWCFENGKTGVRDALILEEFMKSGLFNPVVSDWGGWWVDPENYGPQQLMQNLSENEIYDEQFPEHPLSQLRSFFARLISTLNLS